MKNGNLFYGNKHSFIEWIYDCVAYCILASCVFLPSVDVCVLVLFVWVAWVGPWALFVAYGKYSKMSNTFSLSVLK